MVSECSLEGFEKVVLLTVAEGFGRYDEHARPRTPPDSRVTWSSDQQGQSGVVVVELSMPALQTVFGCGSCFLVYSQVEKKG